MLKIMKKYRESHRCRLIRLQVGGVAVPEGGECQEQEVQVKQAHSGWINGSESKKDAVDYAESRLPKSVLAR